MKKLICFFIVFMIFKQFIFCQSIINVQFKKDANKIAITYDLQTENPVNISLHYSLTDTVWNEITQDVSGDVGENIMLGQKKQINWNLTEDKKNINENNIQFRVSIANKIEIPMVFVKGGNFTMGCTSEQVDFCGDDEKPTHKVTLSSFDMSKYEITIKLFKEFIDKTAYITEAEKKGSSYVKSGTEWVDKKGANWKCDESGKTRPESEYNYPVIHVSWNDATAFCKWISTETGNEYRLPSEAQWEFAARGGTKIKFKDDKEIQTLFSGNKNLDKVAWFDKNSKKKPHPVGQKKPNNLGIYDMSGNVWEWCSDWYNEKYYKEKIADNPKGDLTGFRKVLRGGGWNDVNEGCRISYRGSNYSDDRSYNIGFRVISIP